ncbi:MAG: phospholipase D-like domain-containing protein [Ignavibacteriaceae bacterium]
MTYLKIFIFILLTTAAFSQTVVPISEMRVNDANGIPVGLNQIYTISGIVTSSNQIGTAGPATIQDITGGMAIYGSAFAGQVAIGDSVTVTGTLTHYNGLAEVSATISGFSFVNHSSGNYFDTTIVTLSQIANQQWSGFEEFESRLIRINNVTISGGTGVFVGNTNYNLTDASTTLTQGLRIDSDVSSIVGTTIPTSPVDLIGVLAQYDNAAPFSSGYQLMPRFVFDIIDDGSPLILNPIIAANIDTSSFTVYFNTARNGNSQIKYGLTTALELDSVVIDDDTTYHIVPVTGLNEVTHYYYRAYSTNENGTSVGALQSITTASSDPTVGAINVYFNFSVDTTVTIPGNKASGNVSFEQKLIERINASNYSIDLALYSFFGMPNIASAIVAAKNRGVKVRVVYDNRTTQNSMQTLIDAGIPVLKRTASLDGIMHNKFFIFDGRDSNPVNDWIWTGSWNVTSTEINWKNNVVEINDAGLAYAYTTEFQEMWGSSTEIPNSTLAKFGSQKTDNTTHFFTIGGKDVRLYFSPSDGTNSKILSEINSSQHNIYFAQYAFTRSDLANGLNQKYVGGVTDIRGVIDQANTSGSQYTFLDTFVDLFTATDATQHHKYAIFDPSYSESNPTVLTGSHNWSNAADQDNDENTLIINDVYIANKYMQEFKKRYNEAGGTSTFIIPVTDVDDFNITEFDYQLFQNYPNPFNPVTTIRFEIPKSQRIRLSVFDILGREVKVIYDDVAPAGIVTVDFTAGNLASGMYVYQLKTADFSVSKKMVLLK